MIESMATGYAARHILAALYTSPILTSQSSGSSISNFRSREIIEFHSLSNYPGEEISLFFGWEPAP